MEPQSIMQSINDQPTQSIQRTHLIPGNFYYIITNMIPNSYGKNDDTTSVLVDYASYRGEISSYDPKTPSTETPGAIDYFFETSIAPGDYRLVCVHTASVIFENYDAFRSYCEEHKLSVYWGYSVRKAIQ